METSNGQLDTRVKFGEGLRMEAFKSGGYFKDQSRAVDDISKVECRL